MDEVRTAKWSRGAYATPPGARKPRDSNGQVVAAANIECWLGTVDELCRGIWFLEHAHASGTSTSITLTLVDGTALEIDSVDELRAALRDHKLADVAILRAEISNATERGALLVARKFVPGILVEVRDSDVGRALGNAEVTFQGLMAGYVDRLGGFRATAVMLSAIAPVMLIGIALSPGDASALARFVTLALASVASNAGVAGCLRPRRAALRRSVC